MLLQDARFLLKIGYFLIVLANADGHRLARPGVTISTSYGPWPSKAGVIARTNRCKHKEHS